MITEIIVTIVVVGALIFFIVNQYKKYKRIMKSDSPCEGACDGCPFKEESCNIEKKDKDNKA